MLMSQELLYMHIAILKLLKNFQKLKKKQKKNMKDVQESNGETYLQKELMKSTSPLLKDMYKAYVATGSLHITIAYGKLRSNQYGCLDAFETDQDVQFLVTWIFWQYLCYCVNIDFMTGEDKTKLYIGR